MPWHWQPCTTWSDAVIPLKTAVVANVFKARWVLWAGIPEDIVVDKGSGSGAGILTFTSDRGIFHRAIPVEYPWQQSMVERHVHVLEGIINAILVETNVSGKAPLKDVLLVASLAKDRIPGRTGYTPIPSHYLWPR